MKKRITFIEQISSTECGITCVAMLLRYYNSYVSLQQLRELLDTGRDGTSIGQLVALCKKLDLVAKPSKIDFSQIEPSQPPFIAFCYNSHFLVVEKISRKYVYLVDPASGAEYISHDQFKEIYSGYIIQIRPDSNFKTQKKDAHYFSEYVQVFKEKKGLFAMIFLVSIIIYAFSLAVPILMKNAIDSININAASAQQPIAILILTVGLASVLGYVQSDLLIQYRIFMDYKLTAKVVRKLLDVSYHFFELRRKSDLIMTINSGYVIREIVAKQLVQGIINVGAIIFMVVYLYLQSPTICLLCIALFLLNAIFLGWSRPRLLNEDRQLLNKRNEVDGQQVELIYSILGIKMAGIENYVFNNWSEKECSYLQKQKRADRLKNKYMFITALISQMSPYFVLAVSINLFRSGTITLGDIMAFYSLSSTFFGLAASVSNVYNSYVNSTIYLERINDILTFEQDASKYGDGVKRVTGDIELKNVSFSYSKHSSKVLKNISIKISPGQKVAVVGMSGSGKSTLGKVMMGLYKPTEGTVMIDHTNIHDFDTSELRQHMGIVPQDMTLFNRSIEYNIGMGRSDVSRAEIVEAAKIARIHDEIIQMPMKYDTQVTEMGMNLSGGQRQRIVLARAILKKPKLIILDEATSALDTYNESQIFKYFKAENCTQIIIAHRLSTVMDADVIMVMDEGEIVDIGSHTMLLEKSNIYKKIHSSNKDLSTTMAEN